MACNGMENYLEPLNDARLRKAHKNTRDNKDLRGPGESGPAGKNRERSYSLYSVKAKNLQILQDRS